MKTIKYLGKNNMEYYTKLEMKDMYPDGQYEVIGEISEKKGKNKELTVYSEEGKPIYVQPIGTYKKNIYINDGFLWNEEAKAFISIKKLNWTSLIGVSAVVLVLVVGIGFGLNFLMNNSSNSSKTTIDTTATAMESDIERDEGMDPSRILIAGFNEWNMVAATDEVYIPLFNPDGNPCNFRFTVILDETQEELFSTGLIPPGQAVTTVKLPRVFEEGTYPITVRVDSYSLEDEDLIIQTEDLKTDIVAIVD